MRIFLTGATGYIGSSVLDALLRAGHQVTVLIRTRERAEALASQGAKTVLGELGTPSTYRRAALNHDGYIHTAADPTARASQVDRTAIETLLAIAHGENGPRFFIYTSGVWVLGNTPSPAGEDAPINPAEIVVWRAAHERAVLTSAGNGLRTLVVRPGIVFGGQRGIVSDLLKAASNGMIRVVGDGSNRWPLVYDRDLADLYIRLVAHSEASGVYHANDEADERVNDIVAGIAAHMPVRPDVRHVPLGEARAKLGSYADALALDQVVRSRRARELGWAPTLKSVSGNVPRLLEEWSARRR